VHTLQLTIDDSIFEKFMKLLDTLPKEKVLISTEVDDDFISFEEAQRKVPNAINNISADSGVEMDTAFNKILDYTRGWTDTNRGRNL